MARHVGQNVETGEHLVVHFMVIPEQTTNALVTETAKVPEPLRGTLLRALGELQGPEDLAQALSRRTYADSNKSLFQVLHETGHLKALPIDKIVMVPDGNHRIPLRAVLESMGRLAHNPGQDASTAPEASKFNPHRYNSVAGQSDEMTQKAQNLLVEAELLEGDARAKRAQAYAMAPTLNPALIVPEVQAPAPAPAATETPAPTETPATDTTTPPATDGESA
jgi:hypothetical protein